MDNKRLFHRPDIAAKLAATLLGDDPLNQSGRSGRFLAAPRRTGKSTFLRSDFIPAIEAAGAIAVYVDLWVDKTLNPADLITEAGLDFQSGGGFHAHCACKEAQIHQAAAEFLLPHLFRMRHWQGEPFAASWLALIQEQQSSSLYVL